MKNYIFIVIVLFGNLLHAQGIYEYGRTSDVTFKIYSDNENILRKNSTVSDNKLTSPEDVVKNFFFATSNEDLLSLYSDKEQFSPKNDSHFNNVKKTDSNDMYVQLLHKTGYTFQGYEMCYVMFIAKIKDINFPFPTLLSLVKRGDSWSIQKRANQQKITDCLIMLKPCVLSNLIEGNSQDGDIKKLIVKTKSIEASLDFGKLFDELVLIQNNEELLEKLTMSQNLECQNISHKQIVKGQSYVTDIFKNISIKNLREQDEVLISRIKKNSDSIVLTSKLNFDYSEKKYELLKFTRIKANNQEFKEVIRLDDNTKSEKPVTELIALFENLETKIFSDLSPSMNENPIMQSDLYKESRGVYEVLNTTKLYNLFVNKNELFSNYIYR